MSNYNIQYALQVKDSLTPALRKALATLKQIDKIASKISGKKIKIDIDTKAAMRKMKEFQRNAAKSSKYGLPAITNQLPKNALPAISRQLPALPSTFQQAAIPKQLRDADFDGSRLERIRGRFGAMESAFGAFGGAAALKMAINEGMEFEKVLVDTAKFSGKSGEALDALKKQMLDISNATGQAATSVGLITNEFIKLNDSFTEDDLKALTMLANKASMAWDNIAPEEAGLALAVVKDQWKLSNDQLEVFANQIDYISDKIPNVGSDYIIKGFAENSGMVQQFGLNSDSLMGFLAAADSSKADLGKAGGSLKKLLQGMRDSDNSVSFEKLGLGKGFADLAVKDANMAMGKFFEAMGNYKGSDKFDLLTDIVGNNYNDTMAQILTKYDYFHKSLEALGNKEGYAGRLEEGQKKYLESAVGQMEIAKTRFKNIFADMMSNNKLLGKSFGLIGKGLTFLQENPKIVEFGMAMTMSAVAVGGLGLAVMAVTAPMALLVAKIAAVGYVLYSAWENSSALRNSFSGLSGSLTGLTGDFNALNFAAFVFDSFVTYLGIGIATLIAALKIVVLGVKSLAESFMAFQKFDFKGVVKSFENFGQETSKIINGLAGDVSADIRNKEARAVDREISSKQADISIARDMAGIGLPLPPMNQKVIETAAATQKAAADMIKLAADTQKSGADRIGQAAAQMVSAASQMLSAASRPITVNVGGGGDLGGQGR